MEPPSPAELQLIITVFSIAFGAIVLCTAPGQLRLVPVALVIGSLAAFLTTDVVFQPSYSPHWQWPDLWGWSRQAVETLEIAAMGAFVALCVVVALTLLRAVGFVSSFFDGITTERWSETSRRQLAPRDYAKRYFVAIASITGAVVFALFTNEVLWTALEKALRPQALFGTIFVSTAGAVLVGPFRDYVLDQSGQSDTWIDHLFSGRAALRSVVRFLLVQLAGFAVNLTFNCVSAVLADAEPLLVATVVSVSVAPAIVSYYWCAALQTRPKDLTGELTAATTSAGTVFYLGPALIILAELLPKTPGSEALVLFLGLVLACLFGFVYCGLFGLAGGMVFGRSGKRGSFAAVIMLALLVVGLQILLQGGMLLLMGAPVGAKWVLVSFAAVAGWLTGLFASGFPQLILENGAASVDSTTDTEVSEPNTG